MCKYILTRFLLCECNYWSLESKCGKTIRRGKECGLYPYPVKKPDVVKLEKCEFCNEDFEERREELGR
jgi:hypothetical protein